MRAMILEHPGPAASEPLRRVELETPAPGPGMLVARVVACGVCRTDLQLVEGDIQARALPIVPGHQVVGLVEAVGAGVTGFQVGHRIGVAWLGGADGSCVQCRAERENLCERATFTGWDSNGGYASHIAVRADFALRIPEGFQDLAAAPLLCGGVIGYRSLERSGIKPGGRLGLYGFGASALITIQVARHWGCRVFVATRSVRERERARELGAEWTGEYAEKPPEALDAAITFAPSGDVVRSALRALDRGGTVAINAIHLDRIPELPYEEVWWERNIVSVANFTRRDAREFLELAAKIPIRTAFETHPLEKANVALDRLSKGQVDGAAVLVP
ncbi:MAG TPA: zinc-dependent alcohol dehydrogenase family protein [Polyangiaceae bacterium]|nr:zinc-dependent alcohol dehydrogenase family protein [Polyangiaceae bacterium]